MQKIVLIEKWSIKDGNPLKNRTCQNAEDLALAAASRYIVVSSQTSTEDI
jgi:hypothetical protein